MILPINKSRGLALLLSFLLFPFPPISAAEPSIDATAPNQTPGSYVGQAIEAVGGRVFGVEGDASDIKYHVVEFTGHSRASAATRSLIVPGWGQHFNNEPVKGTVLFLATAGALYGAIHLHNKSENSYDDYKAVGQKDSGLYDDYQQYRSRSIILGSTAAVLWILGIFDAYRNAYHPVYSKNPTVDIALVDNGAEVSVKKSF